MKNFKVVLAFLPVFILVSFIYFTTNGYSTAAADGNITPVSEIKKPSDACPFYISIGGSSGCLTGSYTYCINGGDPVSVSGNFDLKLECGYEYVICVRSSNNCYGTVTVSPSCPCSEDSPDSYRVVTLSSSGAACACANS